MRTPTGSRRYQRGQHQGSLSCLQSTERSQIKDRNGRDLKEAKDIKKRWQEYTEELYKKELHDPNNHDGVIPHLEPDIM